MGDEYDIYLGGVGYMLAKDEAGQLQAGSVSAQASDPFARYTAEEERWKIASFRFSEGSGALKFDGTKRYAFGENVDTRSGDWMRGPEVYRTGKRALDYRFNNREGNRPAVADVEVSNAGGDHDGYAFQFTASAAHTEIRSVGLLVKRRSNVNYDAAGTFDVEIRADTGGGVPAAAAVAGGQVNVSPVFTEHAWLPHENLWLGNEYFWLEVTFSAIVTIVATDPYWLCLMNAQAFPIDWAETPVVGGLSGTVASWNGAAWTASTDQVPYCVVQYADDIDAFTRAFATFAGSDNIRRLYAAVGAKVMYWDDATSAWLVSKDDFPQVVHDLIDFGADLYAACGDGTDMWFHDGTTATGTWTAVTGVGTYEAQCFALHDNFLWKADVAVCHGTTVGHGAGLWAGNSFVVGDPQTPISKMISHGGKLFCAKPEGIFEVTYPDTWPGADTPTANMIHDFTSDRYGRNFILDWHSGCYFPGPGGVYQWMSGVLQDVWRQRFTQDADGTPLLPTYTDRKGEFRAAHGSTRGVVLGSYSAHCGDDGVEHPGGCHLYWFDGRYFHSLYSNVFVAEPIHAVFMESRGEGWSRIWWGQGFDIYYMDWPTWTDDRTADDRCQFFTVSNAGKDHPTLWTPWVDDDKPEILKDWYAIRVHCKNVAVQATTEGGTIAVFYYNDDGARTSLGTITGNTDPDNVLYFPASTTGYRLQLEFLANTIANPAYTFRVYAIELLYQPLYDTITQYHVTIRIGDNMELRSGSYDQRSGKTQAEALDALLEEPEPWVYQDELGSSRCVRAVGATRQASKIERKPSGRGGGLQVSGTVMLSMLKVADTCPS